MQIYELTYEYCKGVGPYEKDTRRYVTKHTAELSKDKLDWAAKFLRLEDFESYITIIEVEE